jgi:Fe-S-cluster containining protein
VPSHLVTDLVQIRRLGEKKLDENLRFRRFLKSRDYPDRRFRRMSEEIANQIDCRSCANCCRVAITPITERDIERLAKHLRLSIPEFLERYTDTDPDDGEPILKKTANGCIFLEGNDCSVYEARPHNCVDFPHLVRGNGSIASRMWQFVDRASYCPIVYNALEAFKAETRFRR